MTDRIGPYEIRGELGRGAMAVVWRGHDPTIGRAVALKEPRLADRSGYPTQYPAGGYMMDAAIARDRFEYSMAVLPSGGGVFE